MKKMSEEERLRAENKLSAIGRTLLQNAIECYECTSLEYNRLFGAAAYYLGVNAFELERILKVFVWVGVTEKHDDAGMQFTNLLKGLASANGKTLLKVYQIQHDIDWR